MPQPTTAELLEGRRSRIVTAHPDDSIWYASLGAANADEALMTRGEKGRNGDTVDRIAEERRALRALGLTGLLTYEGNDRKLHEQVDDLALAVAEDAMRDGVNMLVGNRLPDHTDHLAAGMVAVRAGQLALASGFDMGVLLLRPDDRGSHIAPATLNSVGKVFRAAWEHKSQWGMDMAPSGDMVPVPGDYYMSRKDFEALQYYPLARDASFDYISGDGLAGLDTGQPAFAGSALY